MPNFPFNQGHLAGPSAQQNPEERPGQHVNSRLCALGNGQMQVQMHPACEYMALPLEQTLGLPPETFLKAPGASKSAYPRAKAPGVYCPPWETQSSAFGLDWPQGTSLLGFCPLLPYSPHNRPVGSDLLPRVALGTDFKGSQPEDTYPIQGTKLGVQNLG